MGNGRHLSHTDLPVGGGWLRGGAFLQRLEADHEEGAVWGQAAGYCIDARLATLSLVIWEPFKSLHSLSSIKNKSICKCRNQNSGGTWSEWMWHPHPAACPWGHPVWSSAEGRGIHWTEKLPKRFQRYRNRDLPTCRNLSLSINHMQGVDPNWYCRILEGNIKCLRWTLKQHIGGPCDRISNTSYVRPSYIIFTNTLRFSYHTQDSGTFRFMTSPLRELQDTPALRSMTLHGPRRPLMGQHLYGYT